MIDKPLYPNAHTTHLLWFGRLWRAFSLGQIHFKNTQKRRFYFDCIVRLGSNAITETSVGACLEEASWMTGQTIALNGGACTA